MRERVATPRPALVSLPPPPATCTAAGDRPPGTALEHLSNGLQAFVIDPIAEYLMGVPGGGVKLLPTLIEKLRTETAVQLHTLPDYACVAFTCQEAPSAPTPSPSARTLPIGAAVDGDYSLSEAADDQVRTTLPTLAWPGLAVQHS